MPHSFEFDAKYQVVQCKFSGQVSDQELKDFYREASESAEFLKPRGAVIDFTSVTSFRVTIETVRTLAKAAPALKNFTHSRVIVAPALHIFLLARIFETEGEGKRPSLHVVRKPQEAWAILGIADPEFKVIPENIASDVSRLKAFEWKKSNE